jgi:hypothetical protein
MSRHRPSLGENVCHNDVGIGSEKPDHPLGTPAAAKIPSNVGCHHASAERPLRLGLRRSWVRPGQPCGADGWGMLS